MDQENFEIEDDDIDDQKQVDGQENPLQRLLTAHDAAIYCHVTRRAVLKWIEEGKLSAHRTPGRHVRIELKEFLRFMHKYNLPLPDELLAYGRKKRVLIIDDEATIVRGLRRAIECEDTYDVEFAFNGFSAGLKLNSFKPDVVVVDINMPGMRGDEVIRQIRQKDVSVGIIIYSGHISPAVFVEFGDISTIKLLDKSSDTEVLLKTIEFLCSGDNDCNA